MLGGFELCFFVRNRKGLHHKLLEVLPNEGHRSLSLELIAKEIQFESDKEKLSSNMCKLYGVGSGEGEKQIIYLIFTINILQVVL